jgi:hypothetical protein
VAGSAASLAANVAVAESTATGRVIAAWPSFALIASYELLMRQVRRAADATAARRPRPLARLAVSPAPTAGSEPAARRPATTRHSDAGLQIQVQAWRWALANRADDGSLPSGKDIGLHHGRQERWGRVVKRSGLAGELRT